MTTAGDELRARGFWDLVIEAVPALAGAAVCFSTAFGIFAYFVSLDVIAPVAWIFVAAASPLAIVVMLSDAIRRAARHIETAIAHRPAELPRVLRCLHVPGGPGDLAFLVEPSNLLGQGVAVSVYSMVNEFEVLICEGFVKGVQQDGKVQIFVMFVIDGNAPLWQQLTDNSPDVLRRTLVRPGQQVERRT